MTDNAWENEPWDEDEDEEEEPDSSRPISFQPPLPCESLLRDEHGQFFRDDAGNPATCGRLTTSGRYWRDDPYILMPACEHCMPDVLLPNPRMP